MKLKPNLHEGPGSIDHGSKIGGFSPIIRLNKKKDFKNWAQVM
jgi:hypothetical protein